MVIKCLSLCREKFLVLVFFSDNVFSYSAFLMAVGISFFILLFSIIFIFESKVYLLKYIVG